MKQNLTSGERRGLIAVMVAIGMVVAIVVWQRSPRVPAKSPDAYSVTVTPADSAKVEGTRSKHKSDSSRVKANKRTSRKSSAKPRPIKPARQRSPLDEPV